MNLTPRQLAALPQSAQQQIARQRSRDLGRGNATIPQPTKKEVSSCSELNVAAVPDSPIQCVRSTAKRHVGSSAAPKSNPSAAANFRTFYKAAACYARIVPVEAQRQPKDEAGERVRFFTDYTLAFNWVLSTFTDEIDRLTHERTKLLARPQPPAE